MKSPSKAQHLQKLNASSLLQARRPYSRMLQIFQILKGNQYPSRDVLAEKTDVTIKTIQRDIDFMRASLQLPIDYDHQKGGYFFSKPIHRFPMMEISEEELISIFIAQKAITLYRGTPFEQPIRKAFDKLVEGLDGKITISWEDLETFLEFRNPVTIPLEAKTFQVVSEAIRRNKLLLFDYKKLASPQFEPRRAEPYQLVCYRNQWYCFGHDIDRDAMRTYVLSRMQKVVLGDGEFIRPENFSVQEHLKNSFGVFSGPKKLHDIILRFDPQAAQAIRDRVWHASQSIHELPGGEVELSLSVNSLFEIEAWILSWGDHVQVLKPMELINRVANIARKFLEKHQRKSES